MYSRLRFIVASFSLAALLFGAGGELTAAAIKPLGTAQSSSAQAATTVQTEAGDVEGVLEDDLVVFRGIPYAAPPIGDLRWRAPQPVTPWTEALQATAFGHDCMQVLDQEHIQTTPSEDCLYVNVWKPVGIEPDAKLPVMVWIHGGGFVQGGSSDLFFDGTAFAREGIVVVSFNYRLGRLGFFAHPALLAAGEGPVGNFGLMDQIAALQWVQRNIAAFGGDPAQVTIMGQSAGGASVLIYLTFSESEGLFHQVVVMSGGGRKGLALRPMTGGTAGELSADQTDTDFAASLGIEGDGPDALAVLRALPAEELVGDLNLNVVAKGGLRCAIEEVIDLSTAATCVPLYDGTQMIDGTIVTGQPGEILRRGDMASVPMMIGTTAADVPAYFPPSVIDPYPYFGADADRARAHYSLSPAIAEALVAAGHPELITLMPTLAMGADMTMHEPARFAATQMTQQGNSAWLYRFTYVAESERPSLLGQKHAGEIPFLFQTLDASYPGAATDKDREMAQAFHTYVANFIKTGDPNGNDLPLWPPFDPAQYDLMNFTLDDGPVFGPDPRAEGVELIQRSAGALGLAGVSQLSGVLTGTVTYRQRIPLPSGSVIEVQLQDVSRADAPAEIIASQTISTAGENVPISFALRYDPAQIDSRFTYALSVRITVNGQLRWINTEQIAVLTREAPLSGVEVMVQPVSADETAQATAEPVGDTYADPFAYCAAVGTVDAPDDRFVGEEAPEVIAEGLRDLFGRPADTPLAYYQRTMVWRCMGGEVYACIGGANLPCSEQADLSTEPTSAMQEYCAENPDADVIPMVVTGRATVYTWQCMDGNAHAGDAMMTPDAQGFLSEIWYRLEDLAEK